MPLFKKPKIGRVVHYVQNIDTQPGQEVPNKNPAMITQVNPDSCDLVVFHSNGSYHVRAKPGNDDERGTYHFPRLLDDENG